MVVASEMQVFVEVVRQGSFSAAARSLGLASSVVADRVARLEKRLGVQLLVRSTRHQTLTEAGRCYHDEAKVIVEAIATMERRVEDHASSPRGSLKITAPAPIGRRWIAPFVGEFKTRHPDIRVHLTIDDQFADIIGDGFDIAIRGGPVVDSHLIGRRLMESRRVIVASPGYLAKHGRPDHPEDLARHVCLITSHHPQFLTEWRFGKGAEAEKIAVTGELASSDSELPLTWALNGLGIAQKSYWEVVDFLRDGSLVTVLDEHEPDPAVFFAIHPVSRSRSRKTALFIEELAVAMKDLIA